MQCELPALPGDVRELCADGVCLDRDAEASRDELKMRAEEEEQTYKKALRFLRSARSAGKVHCPEKG